MLRPLSCLVLLSALLATVAIACTQKPTTSQERIIQKATEDAKKDLQPEVGVHDVRIDEVAADFDGARWRVHIRGQILIEGASPPQGKPAIYQADEMYLVYDDNTGRLISRTVPDNWRERLIATAVVPTPGTRPTP
ncbi:MAG: hypothetical protein M0Z94_09705 [Dehalococcoidales bacterium]|nr:hypothetical protein [Dehalococcoidales bacterium]